MSETELHTGKLIKIPTGDIEQSCKAICKELDISIDDYDSYSEALRVESEDYVTHNGVLYKKENHITGDTEDFSKFTRNEDGSIDFVTIFNNGGTCLNELICDFLDIK